MVGSPVLPGAAGPAFEAGVAAQCQGDSVPFHNHYVVTYRAFQKWQVQGTELPDFHK